MAMQAKLARLTRLLDEGYELEDIRSDAYRIEARLARGPSRAIVAFDRADARALLYEAVEDARAFARRARVR